MITMKVTLTGGSGVEMDHHICTAGDHEEMQEMLQVAVRQLMQRPIICGDTIIFEEIEG